MCDCRGDRLIFGRNLGYMIREIREDDYPRLMDIWESAVKSTHEFLLEEDFLYFKERLPIYFQYAHLFGLEKNGAIYGFIGVAEGNLEMLFVHNNYRGMGVGKELAQYAIDNLSVTKVDVNEQNLQAIGFYTHIGFHVVGRSELDGQGKAYPILHMEI